jgi:hypothetical protein
MIAVLLTLATPRTFVRCRTWCDGGVREDRNG